jgi:hypothetical protein
MKKISVKEMKTIEENLNFYDFINFSSNESKEILIEFHEDIDIAIYSDIYYCDPDEILGIEQNIGDEKNIIIEFSEKLFEIFHEDICIIKNRWKWISNGKNAKWVNSTLRKKFINNWFKGGILVEKNSDLIKIIIEAVCKGIYNDIVIIFKQSEVIICLTDHMDLYISARNLKEVMPKIEKILSKIEKQMLVMEIKDVK